MTVSSWFGISKCNNLVVGLKQARLNKLSVVTNRPSSPAKGVTEQRALPRENQAAHASRQTAWRTQLGGVASGAAPAPWRGETMCSCGWPGRGGGLCQTQTPPPPLPLPSPWQPAAHMPLLPSSQMTHRATDSALYRQAGLSVSGGVSAVTRLPKTGGRPRSCGPRMLGRQQPLNQLPLATTAIILSAPSQNRPSAAARGPRHHGHCRVGEVQRLRASKYSRRVVLFEAMARVS